MSPFPAPGRAARRQLSAGAQAGCLIVFALPFAGFGLVALGLGARDLARDPRQSAGLLLFGLVFALVGFGLIGGALWSNRRARQVAAHRAATPDQPWLWRADWAAGRIASDARSTAAMAWVFATLWNLISWPVVFVLPRELAKHNYPALIALLFPAVGLGLLAWAIREGLRRKAFGTTVLELRTCPAAPGGALAGLIRLAAPLQTFDPVKLTLTGIRRRVTGSGKHRSTHEDVLWQEEQLIRKAFDIPVFFLLPPDVPTVTDDDPNDRILWRLTAEAAVPGVDFRVNFEVPVFAAPVLLTALTDHAASYRVTEAAPEPGTAGSVRVVPRPQGLELVFPPARNRGFAAGAAVFLVIWTAILVVLIVAHAPVVVALVFGLFELIIGMTVLNLCFLTVKVVAGHGRVEITRTLLGVARSTTLAAADIADVRLDIGMQAGTTPYYDISLVRRAGGRTTAGGMMRNKREAEGLAARLREALGVSAAPPR